MKPSGIYLKETWHKYTLSKMSFKKIIIIINNKYYFVDKAILFMQIHIYICVD